MKIERGTYPAYREIGFRIVKDNRCCYSFIQFDFWKWFLTFDFSKRGVKYD